MKIELTDAGKRFNREWIFRKAHLQFESGKGYAITGANGSGKSTLLQCIGGAMQLSEGSITFSQYERVIPLEESFRLLSFCAPYLELIEEMTLTELLQFHSGFKPLLPGYDVASVIEAVHLKQAANKQLRYYSSGMKQRAKLAQAIFSDTPIVLLDEPTSNLDAAGIQLYHQLIRDHCSNRLVIVCSNDEVEYRFCEQRFAITDFKS